MLAALEIDIIGVVEQGPPNEVRPISTGIRLEGEGEYGSGESMEGCIF